MRKRIFTGMIAGLLATSSMSAPAAAFDDTEEAAAAADKDAMAIEQMTKMFANIFDSKDATPIDPARLTLAEATTAKIMPDGIYSRIMKDMTDKIFGALFSSGEGLSDFEILLTTGVEIDAESFDAAKRRELTAILDPNHGDRARAMQDVMSPMFDKMSAAIEGPMRQGLARAYARKFSVDQLNELNAFLATPTGSFYAAESFALQADPEVMQAVFSALPQMMEGFSDPGKGFEEKVAAIPPARKLSELSDKELGIVAKLLGTSVQELKAYREGDAVTEISDDAAIEAAAEGAAMAAGDAADANDPFANDNGTEPWWNRDNWDEADRKRVEALEAELSELTAKSSAADNAAFDAATEVMVKMRERYLKQGWKPADSSE